MDPKSFFQTLFDFSFSTFITTKLVKILYALSIFVAGLMSIFIVLAALKDSIIGGFFVLVIVAPLFFIMAIIYVRVLLELVIVFFKISEHLHVLAVHFKPELANAPAVAESSPVAPPPPLPTTI